ncbi:MAG: crossover junction endodeoxyribonuclease RuvC [Candidatus Latescibacteria bacterium]|nr:crossover junction endodeoxyribonuclease RuvC [Gemmatimonadaceae bacterium]MDP6014782.1 crossover junction endodeoxyribonuclease RuvC [Candidatus Latescibacterota bacterium]MDP7449895.1 crossover junction endodeoxyribonuclease RuvC [Candidatus Latescibacterota bacterium]HJP29740.1 crossover junction endodeoxyribonuclease RuvC [Candidatus Latescibacterota bacterium]
MLVLGLDPSSTSTGYGLVRKRGRSLLFEDCGCFRPRQGASFADRLQTMYDGLVVLLTAQRPDEVALESSFYGRDADAAAKLGEARGVLRLALVQSGFETALYTPAEVKKAVAGNGQATKEAVQGMVTRLLKMAEAPRPLDASDALAVAICHHHRGPASSTSTGGKRRRPEVEALLRRVAHR